ncbi:coproporphyrinogen III oxidase [Boletus edulis]|nr:coproporphyrinogen III oxidase [Boletus edulis]
MAASSESQPMRERVVDYITQLQDAIVTKLESYGSERFRRESWTRDEGGGGLSCTFPPSPASTDNDHPIEKAGVNISTINGVLPPAAIKQMSTAHAALKDIHTSLPFVAAGLSLIIHFRHPHVPAVHANYRYFEVLDGPLPSPNDGQDQGTPPTVLAWWFGVITDLTPAYVDASDFGHFHNTLKAACDMWISSSSPSNAVSTSVYPAFKASCDDYLYIPHRHEHRGIGGVRFDDMDTDAMQALLARDTLVRLSSQQALFSLVRALGDSFLPSFTPILERRINVPFIPSERRWQLLRRGRAVEFNLVVDRGTKFGLAAPGIRSENVLVGMPPEARWEYCSELGQEDQDTEEAEMVKILKQPRSWVD